MIRFLHMDSFKEGIRRQQQSTNSSYFGTNIINFATNGGALVALEDT